MIDQADSARATAVRSDGLTVNSGPPRPTARFPPPICQKPRPMPPQDRARLNDARQTQQAGPEPSHQRDQGPVASTQLRPLRRPPEGNVQLMPKEEILDFAPASRLEQSGDERRQQMEGGEHRAA
jgi:hypothetical protein